MLLCTESVKLWRCFSVEFSPGISGDFDIENVVGLTQRGDIGELLLLLELVLLSSIFALFAATPGVSVLLDIVQKSKKGEFLCNQLTAVIKCHLACN